MPPIPTPGSRELLQRVKMFIPPLLDKMHKGLHPFGLLDIL